MSFYIGLIDHSMKHKFYLSVWFSVPEKGGVHYTFQIRVDDLSLALSAHWSTYMTPVLLTVFITRCAIIFSTAGSIINKEN